jgi:hypothetical protein
MKKPFLHLLLLFVASLLLTSWGSTGHSKISTDCSLSYNAQMAQFSAWTSILANHSSDADYRKETDPTEASKHYIDIDSYNEFVATGRIPQTLDSVIALYGSNFVYDIGILPWATVATFDSLKNCFLRNDMEKAVLFASDLGHYVGDGHMPLHITTNYNGQITGNYGIHSRYESTMIDDHINEINYSGDTISVIPDVNQYIFDYLYFNYSYVDSVLMADNYAQSAGGSTHSTAYKQALWNATKHFTVLLFKNASHALTELIYTAWVEAGCPPLSPHSVINPDHVTTINITTYPNPSSGATFTQFSLPSGGNILLQLISPGGHITKTLLSGFQNQGMHTIRWDTGNLPEGIYYLVLTTPNAKQTNKILLLR